MPVVGSVFEKPLDDDVYGLQNALAIIVNGDTAPIVLSQGKYIYLINHSTIRSGLYKIISAIASGDTIVSTDIETVPDGIINDLIEADGTKVNKTDIVNNLTTNDSTKVLSAAQGYALNSKITEGTFTGSAATGVTASTLEGCYFGKVCSMKIHVKKSSAGTGWTTVATVPASYKAKIMQYFTLADDDSLSGGVTSVAECRIDTDGNIQIYSPSTHTYWGGMTYIRA